MRGIRILRSRRLQWTSALRQKTAERAGYNPFNMCSQGRPEMTRRSFRQSGGSRTTTVFVAEPNYTGVFTLNGLPGNAAEPVLLVECPRIRFPFARNILSDVTRDGGFPPVLLQPIDFVALWQSRQNQAGGGSVVT